MFIDALIAVFFFLVGLEIKNGIKDFKTALVPIVAALGGMVVPAGIYVLLNPGSHVWAASMPTDIALALGVLSLLGKRVNPHVRIFLLTLAIADDLFSLIVLAIFYGDDLEPIKALTTLGAAAIGFILPLGSNALHGIIKFLTPVSTFFIVPIIIIVNIPWDININAFTSRTTISIMVARSIGKIFGITLFAWLVLRFGGYAKIGIKEITGVATLAGMGLTVALVIADISAQTEVELDQVRLGLFISALLSGISGYIWLRRTPAAQ